VKSVKSICWTALPLLMACPGIALAQEQRPSAEMAPAPDASVQPEADIPQPVVPGDENTPVRFSSDRLEYDSNSEIVTASGEVFMFREGYRLRADRVVWNRTSGEVRAHGNVRVSSPEGDHAYGDNVVLDDDLRDGVIENLLIVLENGGRLAANRATRVNEVTTLERAAYTACAVVDENGCPKDPTWQITALRVIHDPARRRITYQGATLNLFGIPIVGLPGLSHPDRSTGGGSGLLVPDIRLSRSNGLELAAPYYFRLGPNQDATVTPHIFTGALPMIEGEYRHLIREGAYQVRGYVTYGSRGPVNVPGQSDEGIRAYLEGNGRFQLDPNWTVTGSLRYVTDRTFLRRYDISLDTRLRSVVQAERISANSYIYIAGWAFQGLRATGTGSQQQPFVLPAVDARWRMEDPWIGGRLELQANSLSIIRTEGQDTQRAFASARWERRMLTPLGQELLLTAYARGDLYHSSDNFLTPTLSYRGEGGFQGRFIGALAADV
jgi:LPS-assembly protein